MIGFKAKSVRLPLFLLPCISYSTCPLVGEEREEVDRIEAEELQQAELEASGLGVECGCCFGTVAFEKCVQCGEGHLFW